MPARVFISYSHDDQLHRDQLEKHLAVLKHQGLIDPWHDRRILAGADFGAEIDYELARADIVLLLVSSSFLASSYCYSIEMRRALERREAGEAVVIPVIVRPCLWQESPLKGILAAPRDGKPISTWSNYDEAYTEVAGQVREVAARRQEPDHTPPLPLPAISQQLVASPSPSPSPSARRSSNLRLRKEFTDADHDRFLHESFDAMAQFFDESLKELTARNAGIEGRFRRVSADTFTATIYRDGKKQAECAINLTTRFRHGEITFSSDASSRGSSYNEALSVAHDDQTLYLKSMGMGWNRAKDEKLSMELAADLYWEMLISHLQ